MGIIKLNEMIFCQKALYLLRRMYAVIHIRRPLPSIGRRKVESTLESDRSQSFYAPSTSVFKI